MNLRILKKLSKRAVPYLPLIGDRREQFAACRGEGHTGLVCRDRTCWQRGASSHGDICRPGGVEVKWRARRPARALPWCYAVAPSAPLKGTAMVGGLSGYYEPEWEEETAYEALLSWLLWATAEVDGDDVRFRRLRYPREVFRAADRLLDGGAE